MSVQAFWLQEVIDLGTLTANGLHETRHALVVGFEAVLYYRSCKINTKNYCNGCCK